MLPPDISERDYEDLYNAHEENWRQRELDLERLRTPWNGWRGASANPNRGGTMRRIISNYRFQPYIRHGNTSDGQSPVETDPEDAEDSHVDEHNNQTTAVSESLLNVMQTE